MQIAIAITVAAVGSLALTPVVEKLAKKYNAVSRPDRTRRKQARPTAQWGGAAVYAALTLSILASYLYGLWELHDGSMSIVMLLSAGLLCLLGGYDDRAEIRAHWKLLWQITAIAPVILTGHYIERVTMFGFMVDLGWTGMVWTTVWFIVGINALNLIDGMDGLASMLGITISLAVAVIAGSQGYNAVMLPALALAGALAGFSVYNLPPARIYLGDCGSMVIGFVLSFLALQVSFDTAGSANLTVIGLLLFVPLADTCLAIVRRTLRGQSFMTADRGHVHHRLLDRGFGIWSVLALLGCVSLLTGLTAWLTIVSRYELSAWATLAALSVLLINRRLVGHKEWSLTKRLFLQGSLPFIRRLVPLGRLGLARVFRQPSTMRITGGNKEFPEAAEPIISSGDDDTWTSSKKKAA